MIRTTTLLAVTAIAIVGLAVAPGAVAADGELSVDIEQAEDGSATVTVTHDDGAAANASVSVAPTGENVSYDGAGDYATDENGTVGLQAPNQTVEVEASATVDNHSAATVATLEAPTEDGEHDPEENDSEENDSDENATTDRPFGQLVSEFVGGLDANESEGGIGHTVATFVLENNPAADRIPDHAGPPGNDTDRGPGGDRGPGADRGNANDHGNASDRGNGSDRGNASDRGNGGQGPPEHAGPGGDDADRGGPPEHAGPGGDDADEDDDIEEAE